MKIIPRSKSKIGIEVNIGNYKLNCMHDANFLAKLARSAQFSPSYIYSLFQLNMRDNGCVLAAG